MALVTEEEIKKAYKNAPERARDYIDSDELYDAFHVIRKTHNLHLDQAGSLALMIDAIILDLAPFEKFPTMLREALGAADDATYQAVLKDVNEKVFAMFRKVTKENTVPQSVTTPTTTAPPTPARAPNTTELPPLPTPKPPSVAETKLAVTSAPAPVQQVVPPPAAVVPPHPAPTAPSPKPPTYHGTDPYREPFE